MVACHAPCDVNALTGQRDGSVKLEKAFDSHDGPKTALTNAARLASQSVSLVSVAIWKQGGQLSGEVPPSHTPWTYSHGPHIVLLLWKPGFGRACGQFGFFPAG